MTRRIVFTGGSGTAGAIERLQVEVENVVTPGLEPWHHVLAGVDTLSTDVTDSGQVCNALTMHHGFNGDDKGRVPSPPDAVVHTATKPGVRKVIIASSETTDGVCFAEGDKDCHNVPPDNTWSRIDARDLGQIVHLCIAKDGLGFRKEHDWWTYV